jgi:hypothetical protein
VLPGLLPVDDRAEVRFASEEPVPELGVELLVVETGLENSRCAAERSARE